MSSYFFFFNDTATTEIYTLSLHDALPISLLALAACFALGIALARPDPLVSHATIDRKSTRLNSSHLVISYAVFCLKKKKLEERSSISCKNRDTDCCRCAAQLTDQTRCVSW